MDSLILTHSIGRENFFLLVEFDPIGNMQQGGGKDGQDKRQ